MSQGGSSPPEASSKRQRPSTDRPSLTEGITVSGGGGPGPEDVDTSNGISPLSIDARQVANIVAARLRALELAGKCPHDTQPERNVPHANDPQDDTASYCPRDLPAHGLHQAAIQEPPRAPTQGSAVVRTAPDPRASCPEVKARGVNNLGSNDTTVNDPSRVAAPGCAASYDTLVRWDPEEDLRGVGAGLRLDAEVSTPGGRPACSTR